MTRDRDQSLGIEDIIKISKIREDSQGRGYYRAYSRDRSRNSRDYRNDRSKSRDRGYTR